jgi:hypothetical protein
MTPWATFIPIVAPHVPGCPDMSIYLMLAESAADFCARTHVWQARINDVTEADESDYTLTAAGVVESVLKLSLDGADLPQVWEGPVDLATQDRSGKPTAFAQVGEQTVRFMPTPDAAYAFSAVVALKPSRAATGIETFLYEPYANDIANGALHRLMMIPGKSWTNPSLGEVHKAAFERGVIAARLRATRNVSLRVKPRHFGGR